MIDGDFLDTVITTPEGWLQFLTGDPLKNEWYEWPKQRDQVVRKVSETHNTNFYFSPHLFSKPDAHKEYALPSRTLCVDLDNADISDLKMNPTVMVETSPGRHQGFWVLKNPPEDFETLSKQLTYTIENSDHSGWPIGHKFRVPGTRNYKYNPPPIVRIIHAYSSERIYIEDDLLEWVGSADVSSANVQVDDHWINDPPTKYATGPLEVLEKYRANIGPKVMAYYSNLQGDRSDALWALMIALFRAGASRDEVYWVALNSVNNKFKDNKYSAERDLAKDVDRAYRADTTDRSDISQMIKLAERTAGTTNDRKRLVTRIVISDMNRKGEFIFTEDGRYWYLHSNAGRPVQLGKHSEQLDSMLDMSYGLNSSDGFHPYVCNHLINHTLSKGRRAHSGVLSHYDGKEALLLHGGRQDIYRITPHSVSRHPDGQFGVLFPWRPQSEQQITIDSPLDMPWSDFVFEGWFDNLMDFSPEQAKILIRIWFLFILFRDAALSRPIMALLGQQGSGKTALFHLMYEIIYGKGKSLNSISNPEDFDFLTSSDPIVFFDNVDSWTNWLPDRLALAASASDVVKRKLYTDNDTVTLKRQAILGITSHEPKFGRPDVVDRLILINFQRRDNFRSESVMLERIRNARPNIWGSIIQDCQKVLATPDVLEKDIPNFRISDFARVGARIAVALNLLPEFRGIIETLRGIQAAFSLGEDDVLISGIKLWHNIRNGRTPEYVSVGYLFEQIGALDSRFTLSYKTSSVLARKLVTMEPSLKSVFNVDYKYDKERGVRTWKLDPK